MEWQSIDSAPHGKPVIIFYTNILGKKRRIKAIYYERFSEECMSEDSEYDEATDEYYFPEGWYEMIDNWDDYGYVALYPEHKPTHWITLPDYPDINEVK